MPSAPNTDLAVALLALVGGLDAFDAERRLRVDVGEHASMVGLFSQSRGLQQLQCRWRRRRTRSRHLHRLGAGRVIWRLCTGLTFTPNRASIALRRVLGALLRARGDGDVGALLAEEGRGAHADRAGAGEHHGLLALELVGLGEQRHAGRGGGVGAVRIEHHRDAEGAEELLLHRLEQRLALGHVAAADEDRRVLLVLAAAGEDRAVDQCADIVGRDVGVARDAVGAAVIGDHGVEHACVGVGVEQEQELLHGVSRLLLDDVLRLARDERLDVVDELIGKDLHRLLARPGDMRA